MAVEWIDMTGPSSPALPWWTASGIFLLFLLAAPCSGYGEGEAVFDHLAFIVFDGDSSLSRKDVLGAVGEQSGALLIRLGDEVLRDIPGYWTILPILSRITHLLTEGVTWIAFLGEPPVTVNMSALVRMLREFDPSQDCLVGKGVVDRRPTVIHHYSNVDLMYPLLNLGLIISRSLLFRLEETYKASPPTDAFSIDAGYELAKFLKTRMGLTLTSDERICASPDVSLDCVFVPKRHSLPPPSSCGDIYVAVKTHLSFHATRIPVLKKTWLPDVKGAVEIFSDTADPTIPTTKTRVENTEKGHCGKTLEILASFASKADAYSWLLLVDDDTLLSYPRLCSLKSRLDANSSVAVGQRYGFLVSRAGDGYRYNYFTGGAGILMSWRAVEAIRSIGCRCAKNDDPDDMIIGACMTAARVKMIHHVGFHQARPSDYAEELLATEDAISFHKFTGLGPDNPEQVYERWLTTGHPKLLVLNDEL